MSRQDARKPRLEKEERPRVDEQAERRRELFFLERKPIKQYVRHYGWLEVIRDYVEQRRNDGVNRPIRYLTFPGPAATDVGVLWRAGLLDRTKDGFPDVVICDEKHAGEAQRVLGTVRAVSSQPFNRAIQEELAPYFPVDVVNLDMYGTVITGSPSRKRAVRTLRAIRQVIHLQRGQGFLLLLTCSTDDPSARIYLEDCLSKNLNEASFREAYLERYQVLDTSPFNDDYRAFVGLVLPKAIGRMARERGYRIAERFAAKYDSKGHHILCHSFELEPLGRKEPSEKYETCFEKVKWDELNEELLDSVRELANKAYVEFIPTLAQRDLLDVQEILRADSDLAAEMRKQAESLIGWEKQE